VERASDPRNPDPAPKSGRIRAEATRGYRLFWLGEKGVDLICFKVARLGVHTKARSENFPGSARHLLR
jgi:hypothetical protein